MILRDLSIQPRIPKPRDPAFPNLTPADGPGVWSWEISWGLRDGGISLDLDDLCPGLDRVSKKGWIFGEIQKPPFVHKNGWVSLKIAIWFDVC